jgi:hypothetical protein
MTCCRTRADTEGRDHGSARTGRDPSREPLPALLARILLPVNVGVEGEQLGGLGRIVADRLLHPPRLHSERVSP